MVSINAFLHRIPYFCYISITMNLTTTTMKRIFSLFLLPILTVNCVPAQTDEARLYVKLRTGAIDAFARELVAGHEMVDDRLDIRLTTDTTFSYKLSEVETLTEEMPGELPVFTSFKFNNKHNYNLFSDVVATVTDSHIDATVGAIGKRLTPSFTLSSDDARAYINGERQRSRQSRLRFDKPITYTLTRAGYGEWQYRKVQDEVWSTPSDADFELTPIDLRENMLSTNAPSNYDEGLDKLIDGNTQTFFHSTWGSGQYTKLDESDHPFIDISLDEALEYLSFHYFTRFDTDLRCPTSFQISVSADGTEWTDVRTLTADDGIPANGRGLEYTSPVIDLGGCYTHVRLTMLSATYKNYLCLSELSLSSARPMGSNEPELISPARWEYVKVPFGRNVTVNVSWLTDEAENVPRIDIVTETGQLPPDKVNYIGATITINGRGVFPSMSDTEVRIRGRGNSSWAGQNGKSPYRLKFASKQKPFGLTGGKNWVLLANRQANSMTTNAMAMAVAGMMGTAAANHIVPVELYINGNYRGSYNFTEQVGAGNNSLDLDEAKDVLLELDSYYDETYKFRDDNFYLPVNIKDPDFDEALTLLTPEMVQNDFNAFTQAVADGTDAYASLIDTDLSARYLMVNDIVYNRELHHPKSTYLYKASLGTPDAHYTFGPCWDFDWAFGYDGTSRYFSYGAEKDYYQALSSDFFSSLRYNSEEMRRTCYSVMDEFMRNHADELLEYVDDYYNYAHPSLEHNAELWGDGNGYAALSAQCKSWFRKRLTYIYNNMEKFDLPETGTLLLGDANGDGAVTMADVVCVVNRILGQPNENFEFDQADMDASQTITVADVARILDTALCETSHTARHTRLPRALARLTALPFELRTGESGEMLLNLDCEDGRTAAAQMDIILPEGVMLDESRLTNSTAGFNIFSERLSTETGNRYRIAFYAPGGGATLAAGTTELALRLTAGNALPSEQCFVAVENITLAAADAEDYRLPAFCTSFGLKNTTGLATPELAITVRGGRMLHIESATAGHLAIYGANGCLMRTLDLRPGTFEVPLPAGVYIVNHQKVIIQ